MNSVIGLIVVASLFHAAGQALQKHGVASRLRAVTPRQMLSRLDDVVAALFGNSLWVSGLLLDLAGAVIGIQAISLGDITIVKPLAKLQTVFLVLIGTIFLRERLSRREWAGVGFIVAAAVILATAAGPSSVVVPATATSIYLFATTAALSLLLLASHHRWPHRVSPELAMGLSAGMLFGIGDLLIKAATGTIRHGIGSFSVLHADSLGAAARMPEFYLVVVANVAGFSLNQAAFANGRLSVLAPLLGIGGTLFPVIAGFLIFQEQPQPVRLAGIAAMLVGAALLLPRAPRASASLDSEEFAAECVP